MKTFRNITEALEYARRHLDNTGQIQQVDKWQGVQAPDAMFEAFDLMFQVPMPGSKEMLGTDSAANVEWAEEHFQERISVLPFNPPPSNERWPYRQKDNAQFKANEIFSHTYPERFWPRHAGDHVARQIRLNKPFDKADNVNRGIRYEYGDLNDVIDQLINDPTTRQAYLPIFFPEDTGAREFQRVPCTLGYHFEIRRGFLHMRYIIRSCDYYRHFRDDIYMAIRLAQHVLGELNGERPADNQIELGYFKMIVFNLHVFANERKLLERK